MRNDEIGIDRSGKAINMTPTIPAEKFRDLWDAYRIEAMKSHATYEHTRLTNFLLSHAPALLALVEDGWRDISTAPKDGTRVLLMSERGMAIVGLWDKVENDWRATVRVLTKCYSIPNPTHWRPLPTPPKDIQHER